ncbi:MAG TPA: SIS domain-containing protein [Candidatus Magasanikbacteria bacterium]|nr:SIS domain-containing protein [Candidatus Magasanikbacteria bacterium]
MKKLNWDRLIKKFDSRNMYGSLAGFVDQIRAVRHLGKAFMLPENYRSPRNVIVCGMGGSVLAADVIRGVFDLQCPIEIVRDYILPDYVGPDTLVIASSYSGSTEETLSAAAEAHERKANVVMLSAGGRLVEWAREKKIPALVFDPKENPCGSPRMGLGYSIIGQIIILAKAQVIDITDGELDEVEQSVITMGKRCTSVGVSNSARAVAVEFMSREWWFVGARHLAGSAHVAANQTNENAKRFGGYFLLPELNHHLIEGLFLPKTNQRNLGFVFLDSENYPEKIKLRVALTQKILKKNKIKFAVCKIPRAGDLSEALAAIVWSGYLSFYSALVAGFDPTAIPYVDFLKKNLR